MKNLRVSVRTLLIAVAAAGFLTGGIVLTLRSIEYRRLSVQYAEIAAVLEAEGQAITSFASSIQVIEIERTCPDGITVEVLGARNKRDAETRRRIGAWASEQATKYRRAGFRPWESVSPEPMPD